MSDSGDYGENDVESRAKLAYRMARVAPDDEFGMAALLDRMLGVGPVGIELCVEVAPERVHLVYWPTRVGVRPVRARMARHQSDEQLSYACARACARLFGWSRAAHWFRRAVEWSGCASAREACLRAIRRFEHWARFDDVDDTELQALALAIAIPSGQFDPNDALLRPELYADRFVLEPARVRQRARLLLGRGLHDSGMRAAVRLTQAG